MQGMNRVHMIKNHELLDGVRKRLTHISKSCNINYILIGMACQLRGLIEKIVSFHIFLTHF